MARDTARVIDFPITDHQTSKELAADLMQEIAPSALIAIERCGLTADHDYLNFRGRSIAEYNAKIDYLFHDFPYSIGIGDGGNEIGMGNCADVIPNYERLSVPPCVTTTSHLIISSVSNWGGYGLTASLSKHSGMNLLPSIEQGRSVIMQVVDLGGVDRHGSHPSLQGRRLRPRRKLEDATHAARLLGRSRDPISDGI